MTASSTCSSSSASNYLEIIRYMQDVIFSSQITSPEVEYFQTTSLRVTSESAVPVEVDGELIGNCPVQFEIRSRGLRVFAPPVAQVSNLRLDLAQASRGASYAVAAFPPASRFAFERLR